MNSGGVIMKKIHTLLLSLCFSILMAATVLADIIAEPDPMPLPTPAPAPAPLPDPAPAVSSGGAMVPVLILAAVLVAGAVLIFAIQKKRSGSQS